MPGRIPTEQSRRRFLRHVLASPLIAHSLGLGAEAERRIASPKEAINIFDFIPVAQQNMLAAHWAYLETGVDDDLTVKANVEGFRRYQIRPYPFADVSRIDTTLELFGRKLRSPILLAPVGNLGAFHEEADVACARAAAARGHQFSVSVYSSRHPQEIAEAFGGPLWFQLYPTDNWEVTVQLIRRAEAAGAEVLLVTVDTPGGSNRETLRRAGNQRNPECRVCHEPGLHAFLKRHPIYRDIDVAKVTSGVRSYTRDFLDRVHETTRMRFVIKGVMTAEAARECVAHGADAVIVSNHGGRELESLLGAVEALEEVVQAVGGKIPVLMDGGIRRGTDVFKALALGAKAVGIGRPYVWGLGAFGQEGVERVLELLSAELAGVMKQAGAASLAAIGPQFVRRRPA